MVWFYLLDEKLKNQPRKKAKNSTVPEISNQDDTLKNPPNANFGRTGDPVSAPIYHMPSHQAVKVPQPPDSGSVQQFYSGSLAHQQTFPSGAEWHFPHATKKQIVLNSDRQNTNEQPVSVSSNHVDRARTYSFHVDQQASNGQTQSALDDPCWQSDDLLQDNQRRPWGADDDPFGNFSLEGWIRIL